MKKTYKFFVSLFAVIATLIMPSGRVQAKIDRDQKQLIKNTKKDTPLMLYHAKDAFKDQNQQFAWHWSHSSHYSHSSHWSHSSHRSHYSHYSSSY